MPAAAKHDCGEKSHVGMVLCCICQEGMEILLDTRICRKGGKTELRKSLCRNNIVPGRVCDKCEKKYLSEGILVMNPETGSIVVIKDEAFRRFLPYSPENDQIYRAAVEKRRCFCDEAVIQMLMPPKEQSG